MKSKSVVDCRHDSVVFDSLNLITEERNSVLGMERTEVMSMEGMEATYLNGMLSGVSCEVEKPYP